VTALWRRPKLGFLGACFFAILAPTSSVVPVATQAMAEHRMYLPLAAVVTFVVVAAYAGQRKISRHAAVVSLAVATLAACALAATTYMRNNDYRDEPTIWTDTLSKAPGNSRAMVNLGVVLQRQGESEEAMALYKRALYLGSGNAGCNYSNIKMILTRLDKDILLARNDVENHPDSAEAQRKLAWLLATGPAVSRRDGYEAVEHAFLAHRLARGRSPDALDALAAAYAETGRFTEAATAARKALKLAESQHRQKLRDGLLVRVALYESGKPFRESSPLPKPGQVHVMQTEEATPPE